MTEARPSTPLEAATILSDFVRHYAYGLSPRLDAVWLRAVAWQQGNPTAPADPHPDALDPYPRHR
jgi:hypothetical protein